MDEDGTLLEDKACSRERWAGYIGTLLTTKSPKLDPQPLATYSHNGR